MELCRKSQTNEYIHYLYLTINISKSHLAGSIWRFLLAQSSESKRNTNLNFLTNTENLEQREQGLVWPQTNWEQSKLWQIKAPNNKNLEQQHRNQWISLKVTRNKLSKCFNIATCVTCTELLPGQGSRQIKVMSKGKTKSSFQLHTFK